MNKKVLLILCLLPAILFFHPTDTSAATKVTSTSSISTMTSDSDGYNEDVNTGYLKTISKGKGGCAAIPASVEYWETATNNGSKLLPLAHSNYYDLTYCDSVSFYLCFRWQNRSCKLRSSLFLVDASGKEICLDDGYINWTTCTPSKDELNTDSKNQNYNAPEAYKWQHSGTNPDAYRRYYSVNLKNYRNSLNLANCRFEWRGWLRLTGYNGSSEQTFYLGIAIEELKANVHTHSWDDGTITTAATCTSAGVKTYTCTTCHATKTESIPKKDHNYNLTYLIPHCSPYSFFHFTITVLFS